jgi:predicted MFS family arabinose efflux permease
VRNADLAGIAPQAGRRVRITLILLSQSTQNLSAGALALLLPLIRDDIPMTFTEAGALAVAATLVYAFMQVPAGYLGDRFGAKRVCVVGLVGLNVTTLFVTLCGTYEELVLNQAVAGFFRALAFTPGLVLIVAEFKAGRRATAMSLYIASGFLANTILNLVGPHLVAPLGWRGIFALFSGVSLIFVALYWRTREPEREGNAAAGGRITLRQLAALSRDRIVLLSSTVQFVRLAVVSALRFWLPTYFVTDKGLSLAAAGLILAIANIVTLPANLLGGYLSDRYRRPLTTVVVSLCVLTLSFGLLATVDNIAAVVVIVIVQYVFMQAYAGSLFEIPLIHLGSEAAGSLNGFGNFWANIGGLVSAYVLGVSKDHWGSFDQGWMMLCALCLVALVATVLMSRDRAPSMLRPDLKGSTDPAELI